MASSMRSVIAGLVIPPVVASSLVLTGCSTASADSIIVSAAASLADPFEEIASDFQAEHPGSDVVLNLAGSQALARQIVEGAPADVFASADLDQMRRVTEAGLTDGAPEVFATNGLAIAVEAGNPHGITELEDLADPGLIVVLAAEEVPIGAYARTALNEAGVSLVPDSLEPDVGAVRSRVALGEADAGVVYHSDVAGASDITGIAVETSVEPAYPVVVLSAAREPDLAHAFVEFLGASGETLARHGFTPVGPPS